MDIYFSETDVNDLQEFKDEIGRQRITDGEDFFVFVDPPDKSVERTVIEIPEVTFGTEEDREDIERALNEGTALPRSGSVKLSPELIEHVKSSYIATGGNVSEVANLYDLTPEAVLRLAVQQNWTLYGGSHKALEPQSRNRLRAIQEKIWVKIEAFLDSMEVETKTKKDITQHRLQSKYVEALSNRNSAFKNLMDQYMRIGAVLEPELFANDPESSNAHARSARENIHPGGIEGVNRDMANFFADVVVGVADKIKEREMEAYGQIIDARAPLVEQVDTDDE